MGDEARPDAAGPRRRLCRVAVLIASAPAVYLLGLAALTSAFAFVEPAELPGTYVAWSSTEPDRLILHPDGTYTREVEWEGDDAATTMRSRWTFEGEGLVLHGLGMPRRDPRSGKRIGVYQVDCRLAVSRWCWWVWLGDGVSHPKLQYRKE